MLHHTDLPTLAALNEEWRLHPPAHQLVAAYIGYKPRQTTAAQTVTDAEEFVSELGHVPIRRVAPLDTTAFDAEMARIKNGKQ